MSKLVLGSLAMAGAIVAAAVLYAQEPVRDAQAPPPTQPRADTPPTMAPPTPTPFPPPTLPDREFPGAGDPAPRDPKPRLQPENPVDQTLPPPDIRNRPDELRNPTVSRDRASTTRYETLIKRVPVQVVGPDGTKRIVIQEVETTQAIEPAWTQELRAQPDRNLEQSYEMRARNLMRQLAGADGAQRTKHADSLRQVLSEHFDVRMKRREAEITKLEARISALREELDRRAAAKDDIVDLRHKTLVSEALGLGF